MGYFRFFLHLRTFYRPVPYPMQKKITKNPLNYYILKVEKFPGDSVKNESARANKLERGAQIVQPPIPEKIPVYLLQANDKTKSWVQRK